MHQARDPTVFGVHRTRRGDDDRLQPEADRALGPPEAEVFAAADMVTAVDEDRATKRAEGGHADDGAPHA